MEDITNTNPDESLKVPTETELSELSSKLNQDFYNTLKNLTLPTPNPGKEMTIGQPSMIWAPQKPREKKWLIISSTEPPQHGFTDQQTYLALKKAGVKPYYLYNNIELELELALQNHKFDCIYWEGCNGWNYWPTLKNVLCQKINVWYDDPVMRMDLVDAKETMQDGYRRHQVKFFTWDSYWCNKLLMEYGIDAEECHLAASPEDYYESNFSCDKYPIFIGALHSQEKIDQLVRPLVEPFQSMIKMVEDDLSKNTVIPSWDMYERLSQNSLSDGDKRLFKELCEFDPDSQFRFRNAIWMMSKNQVRINMLKAALEVTPVLMFADTKQLGHASGAEVKAMLGDTRDRLKFRDTTGIRSDKLGKFYHWSWIHLQATDPQSVHTGFPYRMFQTQASGRCLLTDYKEDWKKHFNLGETMVAYDSKEELKERLNTLIGNQSLCKEIGRKARREFESKHTWKHRLENFLV